MKIFKLAAMAAAAVVAFAALGAGSASATELDNATGMIATGSTIAASAESTTTLHPPIGDIECSASGVEGTTSNTGGASETVSGNISSLTFTGCNATVTVLAKGSLEIHTRETGANSNGTLTSSGTEVTVEFGGFHCIFKTSSTDIGTLTGSANTGGNATLDIEATSPRTGGRSGAFCGSTAKWTGSYKVNTPSTLNVDESVSLSLSESALENPQVFQLKATNNGNVPWTVKSETFVSDEGEWSTVVGEKCTPETVNPGGNCTRKATCVKAPGKLTWTIKVESAMGGKAESTETVKC